MKTRKRYLYILIILAFIVLNGRDVKATTNGVNQAQAVQWVNDKAASHWDKDLDGNGLWCIDLIKAYYDHLGVDRSSGHAYQYSTNTLPAGWIRDLNPSAGDIIVIGQYGKYNTRGFRTGEFGHIGIVTEVRGDTVVYVSTAQNQYAYPEECYIRFDCDSLFYKGERVHFHQVESQSSPDVACGASQSCAKEGS